MNSNNTVIVMGRLVRDPEITTANTGMSIMNFSIAQNRAKKDASGADVTDYFRCVAFGKTAEHIAKWFHKGERILVGGHLQMSTYNDAKNPNADGTPRRVERTEIIVDNVNFVEPSNKSGTATSAATPNVSAPSYSRNTNYTPVDDASDLPF